MPRRPLRPSLNVHEALQNLGQGRTGAIKIGTGKGYGSPEHVAAQKVTMAIDELAEMLTGDAEYFHLKAHSGPTNSRWQTSSKS